jgi:chaperonin GroEL
MTNERILFGTEAREKIKKGIDTASKAVAATMGGKGRNVLVLGRFQHEGRWYPTQSSTKDGVTVARSIRLDDPFENAGAKWVIEASESTVKQAGDGTTCTAVLLQALVEGAEAEVVAGRDNVSVSHDINNAIEPITKALERLSRPVKEKEDYLKIALISANGDKTIASLAADAVALAGGDGIVNIEESNKAVSEVVKESGVVVPTGLMHPSHVNQIGKPEAIFEDCYVVFSEIPLTTKNQVMALMGKAHNEQKPIVFFAPEIDGEAFAFINANITEKGIKCATVAFGSSVQAGEILNDLAIFTGNKLVRRSSGQNLDRVALSSITPSPFIRITPYMTLVKGVESNPSLTTHIDGLKSTMEGAESEEDKKFLRERIAALSQGIVTIKVGGLTPTEKGERKDRVDDATSAVRAAEAEGFVAGGGVALASIAWDIEVPEWIKLALQSPFKQVRINAGLTTTTEAVKYPFGTDVTTGKDVDMISQGIIDPAKVLRVAVENSFATAAMYITTEVCIQTV